MASKTSTQEWDKRLIDWVRTLFTKLIRYVKNSLLPFARKTLMLLLIGGFLALIIYLTVKGLEKNMGHDYNTLLAATAGTTGTMVAIFFSLVLIPLNQISARYSPRFLYHLRNDQIFVLAFIYSVTSVAYDVIFLYLGCSSPIALAAVLQFILLFVILGILWRHSIFLSNPLNSVLQPEHKRIVKEFSKAIPKYRKMVEKQMKGVTSKEHAKGPDVSYFKVGDEITKYIQDNLLPFREVAVRAIKNGELEQAKNAIGTMSSVVLNYLVVRKEYYNDDDPIMYFLYTEFKLLVKTSNNELKLRLHPFIVDCWRNIGVQAAAVNVKGLPRMGGNNTNNLVYYPVQGLIEVCMANLMESDSTAPGDACKALGDIGVTLMKEGYDNQAAEIIQKLENISLIAEAANIGVFAGSADYAIMRIYASGLAYRNQSMQDPHNYSFGLINKTISNLIATFLKKKRTTFDAMILNPFIGWLTDPINGINLARTAEYALFSDELNEFSLEMNMESVKWNIENLQNAMRLLTQHKDFFFGGQACENLYQTLLILLSYINNPMAADHVFYYKEAPCKNEKLTQKARDLVAQGLKVLIDDAENMASFMPDKAPLDVLFSLYLIILYENKKKKRKDLDNVFRQIHEAMVAMLTRHTGGTGKNPNSNLCKYFRLLRAILWRNKYYKLAKDFVVPDFQYGAHGIIPESEYPERIVGRRWGISRPTLQKNAYYFSWVEEAFGISDP